MPCSCARLQRISEPTEPPRWVCSSARPSMAASLAPVTHICLLPIMRLVHGRMHRRIGGPRCRWPVGPGEWTVRARIERYVEPTILLLLNEGPKHGYELIERLPELAGEERVDVGNLYRILRALEEEGI